MYYWGHGRPHDFFKGGQIYRRSQDFLWGALFHKKVDDHFLLFFFIFFQSSPSQHRPKLLNKSVQHSEKIVKKTEHLTVTVNAQNT